MNVLVFRRLSKLSFVSRSMVSCAGQRGSLLASGCSRLRQRVLLWMISPQLRVSGTFWGQKKGSGRSSATWSIQHRCICGSFWRTVRCPKELPELAEDRKKDNVRRKYPVSLILYCDISHCFKRNRRYPFVRNIYILCS